MRQEILQAAVMGVAALFLFGARVFTVKILMGKVAKKSTLVTESLIALVLLGTVLVVPPAEGLHLSSGLPLSSLSYLCAFGFGVKVGKIIFLCSIPSELLHKHRSLVNELCNCSATALTINSVLSSERINLEAREGQIICVTIPGYRWLVHARERFVTSDHVATVSPFKRLRTELAAESDRLEGVVLEIKGSFDSALVDRFYGKLD